MEATLASLLQEAPAGETTYERTGQSPPENDGPRSGARASDDGLVKVNVCPAVANDDRAGARIPEKVDA